MTLHRGPTFEGDASPGSGGTKPVIARGVAIGPMSEPGHVGELVERHEFSIPVLAARFTGGCATADTAREFARAACWSACRARALDWLAARELTAEVVEFESMGFDDVGAPDEIRWGVRFEVTIGRCGDASGYGSTRREVGEPPEPTERWIWSGRWELWRDAFVAMTDAERLADIEAATLTGLVHRDVRPGEVIDLAAARAAKGGPSPDFSSFSDFTGR